MEQAQVEQTPEGVIPEVATPTDAQPVQPDAQTTEGAQPTVEGQGTPANQESVSYERFKEVNDSKNTLQQQLQLAQQQNQIYQQANLQQVQQQPPQQSRLEQIASKLAEVGDDESLYGKEAKEMVDAFKEEMTNIKTSQKQNQVTSFLAQNKDFSELVGKETVLGVQYSPDFIEMLNTNPAIYQQLQSLESNPLLMNQQALSFARDYQKNKVIQQQLTPSSTPGQPVANGAPPSMSAIPTNRGVNTTASFQSMSNDDFLKMVDGTPKTA